MHSLGSSNVSFENCVSTTTKNSHISLLHYFSYWDSCLRGKIQDLKYMRKNKISCDYGPHHLKISMKKRHGKYRDFDQVCSLVITKASHLEQFFIHCTSLIIICWRKELKKERRDKEDLSGQTSFTWEGHAEELLHLSHEQMWQNVNN